MFINPVCSHQLKSVVFLCEKNLNITNFGTHVRISKKNSIYKVYHRNAYSIRCALENFENVAECTDFCRHLSNNSNLCGAKRRGNEEHQMDRIVDLIESSEFDYSSGFTNFHCIYLHILFAIQLHFCERLSLNFY